MLTGSESVTGMQNTIREFRLENQQALERTRNNMAEGFKIESNRETRRAVDDTLKQAEVMIGELKTDHVKELQEQKQKLQAEVDAAQLDVEMCAESNQQLQEELGDALDQLDDGWPESGALILKDHKFQRCKKKREDDEGITKI